MRFAGTRLTYDRPSSPIVREGWVVLIAAAIIALVLAEWSSWLALLAGIGVAALAWAFRDPARAIPEKTAGLILAPIDGRVVAVEEAHDPLDPKRMVTCIALYSHYTHAHVVRAPMDGRIVESEHEKHPGHSGMVGDMIGGGETLTWGIEASGGKRISLRLNAEIPLGKTIATVREGDMLAAGTRIGFLRLGHQVELYVPRGMENVLTLGQEVIAGETLLAGNASPSAATAKTPTATATPKKAVKAAAKPAKRKSPGRPPGSRKSEVRSQKS